MNERIHIALFSAACAAIGTIAALQGDPLGWGIIAIGALAIITTWRRPP